MARLTGNRHLGPIQTISLAYNPLNTDNQGFGMGFSLGLTQYDSQQRLLSLSTGERYKVDEYTDQVYLKQYKQDGVRFEKDVAQNVYRVIHKSGTVEVLTGPDNAYSLKVPTQIFTPLGHSLTLDWKSDAGPDLYLTTVTDNTGQVLLTVHYEYGSYTRFTVWPGTAEAYDIQLLFENGYVSAVKKMTPAGQTLTWALGYDIECRFLNQVNAPTGLTERVNYHLDGHRFPEGAPLSALPYVTHHTQSPGHGPDIVRTYQYTAANFLGYGAKGHWHADEDYLYGVLNDYLYGSTEQWDNGTTQRHITRRYNQYHLLVSETTVQNGRQRAHQTDYYAQVGSAFDDQPPQFQLPKTARISFNDTPDVEVIQTAFDEAGNPTVQIAPDGTRTDWVYYPAEGEAGACPASPHGFVRFVKSKTVTPGKASPAGTYEDAPIHRMVYRYTSLAALAGTPADYAVVCTYQGGYSAGQLLHESQSGYINDVNSPDHGRIHHIDETVYALSGEEQAAGKTWHSQQTFSYTLQGEALVKSGEWTGHDQLKLTTQRTQSQVSGKLWHEADTQGCTAHYDYDDLGRISAHTSNANTRYAQRVQYAYAIEEEGAVTTTQTDVWGNQVRTRFDGQGHAYQQEILAKGQEDQGWRLVSEIERDSWGRVVAQTQYDWLPVETSPGHSPAVAPIASCQRMEYDDWGRLHRVIHDTGECIQHDYDPVTRTAKVSRQAEGLSFSQCTVEYDTRHQPVTVTLYDSQGNFHSQQQHYYDGLGRLRATVDTLGQKTEYTYDLWGRVLTISHGDGTVIQKSYAPFTTGNLVAQIAVNETVLGTRCFDSLYRPIITTCGGRTYCASYQGEAPCPSQITDPRGQTVNYCYEPRLGNVPTHVDAGDIQQDFTFDPRTGVLTTASAAQQATRSLEYTAAGRLQQETCRFDDTGAGAARKANYTYSPAGQLTAYQDVTGKNWGISFDQFGRPIAARDADIDIDLTYDAASRVKQWTVHDKQHDDTITTTLSFDEFGRETARQIQTATDTLTLTQTYTVRHQIASRTLYSQQAGRQLRQETYSYDPARQWLVEYDCTGVECPRDAYGFSIAHQSFTYDRLGNIQTCITTLDDGKRDTATFLYPNPSDPCQLHTVTHTHPGYPATITLAYDAAGRLIQDEAGRHLTYDALGRLSAVQLSDTTSAYGYDAANRLVLQRVGPDQTHELYYQGATRVTEILRESGVATRLLRAQGEVVAAITGTDTHLLGTDGHSVLVSHQGEGSETRYRYSPYGQQAEAERTPDIPAYNGERFDPAAGAYHLGNGYRAYNPVLMRFNAPDSWSPFGAGGLNPYAYCLGDPLNRIDPTGHISLGSLFGIIGGAVGLVIGLVLAIPTGGASLAGDAAILAGLVADATGIASAATADSNPRASATLGWISMGFGVLSLGAGALGGLASGLRRLSQRPAAFSETFEATYHYSGGEPRLNFASSSGAASTPRLPVRNSYIDAFRHAVDENRIIQVENPRESGFYTVGMDVRGLAADGGDLANLRRVFFRPRANNAPIEVLDNIIPLGNGRSFPLHTSNSQFESLYLHFINENLSTTPHIMGDVIVETVNDLRFFTEYHISGRLPFNIGTIRNMEITWEIGGFSFPYYTVSDWLYHALRNANLDRDLRLVFPDNILLRRNIFQFFNDVIVPNLRF
ncbi:RHS repeat-associated core domain-containing protein [Xenorhabdus griffiniae]|uniref:RHS repeat-associated core domain-containing protein n=2 Tax=Xenorhabdus griffiniae TaxID=351672 RepID=A0ABY9XDX9_9GAMM|nr:RHS repeat-associated core domain-containing protein [Xenorhabdus griffiniae]WMV71129.1 RHS repeat-associated core domain-containing protein [Xenorhabdus griffiniae]WNH00805.1 RHS repeat-associated core domain-containing protein [Xenorhabdus griffiniae]